METRKDLVNIPFNGKDQWWILSIDTEYISINQCMTPTKISSYKFLDYIKHLNESINLWLNDMADWKEFPEKFPEVARKGVEEALKNRNPEIGNTDESLAEYRDKMLIEILKLHNKL